MKELNELVSALYPHYGAPGSRDVDITARRKAIDESVATIAEAFRALEQRAEAAEAKLAEMQRQEPIGRVDRGAVTDSNEYPDARVLCLHDHVGWEAFQDGYELFARPVPAVSLMELVPEPFKVFRQGGGVMVAVRDGRTKNHLYGIGYNACIAEVINRIINSGDLTKPEHESDEATLCKILRNIEGQSQ